MTINAYVILKTYFFFQNCTAYKLSYIAFLEGVFLTKAKDDLQSTYRRKKVFSDQPMKMFGHAVLTQFNNNYKSIFKGEIFIFHGLF